MAIFIDTGKIEEIKKYYEMGIIRGVTTNPTILVKDGVTGGMEGVKLEQQYLVGENGLELMSHHPLEDL